MKYLVRYAEEVHSTRDSNVRRISMSSASLERGNNHIVRERIVFKVQGPQSPDFENFPISISFHAEATSTQIPATLGIVAGVEITSTIFPVSAVNINYLSSTTK